MLRIIPAFFALLVFTASFAFAAPGIPHLTKPPLGDRWFSISKGKKRTGFNHVEIAKTGGGYVVTVESGTRMTIFGFARDAVSWEKYRVNPDLSLRSFEVDEVIDGKPMKLKGEVVADGLEVTVSTPGKIKKKFLRNEGPVYPPPVLNLYPLMQGAAAGKRYGLKMLDIEKVKLVRVKISVIGSEMLPDGTPAVHLQNDLYPFVNNDIWVDYEGNTIRESVRHGLINTQSEDRQSAKKFLIKHPGLAKSDFRLSKEYP
jgi:hypothetical protein